MRLPVDIPSVLKAATDIEGAAKTPLAVSVLIDDSAPGDVVGHVRSAFASAGANTRVTISYLSANPVVPYEADDMAVIIAGVGEFVGEQAQRLREAGIPVMVATTLPGLVGDMAKAMGHPVPEGDIVSPLPAEREFSLKGVLSRKVRGGDTEAVAASDGEDGCSPDEPIKLDEAAAAALDVRMGEWIIAACREKKLAFALAFPFVRRPLSIDSVNATSLQNGAVGLVMFIPGTDMPIMTLNQAKMLLQIAASYGQPLGFERVKELACVVGGAYVCRNIARTVAGAVPVIGWAVKGAVGFAGTQAMGRAAIEYFEAGGDIVGFASVVQKARDEAVDAATKAAGTPAGQKAVTVAKQAVANAIASSKAKS